MLEAEQGLICGLEDRAMGGQQAPPLELMLLTSHTISSAVPTVWLLKTDAQNLSLCEHTGRDPQDMLDTPCLINNRVTYC